MRAFDEGKRRVCVVHATGTGKAYICAAVAERFKKVLVIAPNNFVLNETRKVCPEGTAFRTYASVMYDTVHTEAYDLIVLDEFHRSGAEKWGIGVKRLIDANPSAKLLGLSATHIRYLDGERNMADEMFDGHVVSTLTIKEAIDREILPNPVYVSSIYSLTEDVAKRKRIIRKLRLSDSEKDEKIRRLEGIANNWKNAHGVPAIIRKYYDDDMKRIVVFCSKVRKVTEARTLLAAWLAEAGYENVRFYNIDYQEKRLEKEMAEFQEPCEEGQLKVAISVNMLNEGIHIPRVDGTIMLRTTISRIIIEQQIGRCLTAENVGRAPIVLDLVNNMDLIRYVHPSFNDYLPSFGSNDEESGDGEGFPFKVIDECRDIRLFFGQIDKELEEDCVWAEYQPKLEQFYNEHGRLPYPSENKTLYCFLRNHRLKSIQARYPHRIEWLVEHGFNVNRVAKNNIDEGLDFLEETIVANGGVMPSYKKEPYAHSIYNAVKCYCAGTKRCRKFTEEHRKRFEEICAKYKFHCDHFDMRIEDIRKDMREKYDGNLPPTGDPNRGWLLAQRRRKGLTSYQKSVLEQLGVYEIAEKVCRPDSNVALCEYIREHGLPGPNDKPHYAVMMKFRSSTHGELARRNDPETYDFLLANGFDPSVKNKRTKTQTIEEVTSNLISYQEQNRSNPPSTSSLYGKCVRWIRSGVNGSDELKGVFERYASQAKPRDETIGAMEQYVAEHGALPKDKKSFAWKHTMRTKYRRGQLSLQQIERLKRIGVFDGMKGFGGSVPRDS